MSWESKESLEAQDTSSLGKKFSLINILLTGVEVYLQSYHLICKIYCLNNMIHLLVLFSPWP